MTVLQLSTAQDVFLIIVVVAIALFFVVGTVLLIAALMLVSKVKKAIAKAEATLQSVEDATETLKTIGAKAGGPLAVLKIAKSIIDVASKAKRGK